MRKLERDFYSRDALLVAKELLGKVLVHEIEGKRLAAKIVETEAYRGIMDKAAHFYGGRRTPRVEVIYGAPGFSYVYLIYGMHHCFNIVTGGNEEPEAVLIRAVQPVEGLEPMAGHRFAKPYGQLTPKQALGLTNGPGKLCKALAIDRSLNAEDLCGSRLYVEDGDTDTEPVSVVTAKRVGIDYAEEARDYPWRFYVKDNLYVSVL
ncbi:DNA-3-methyladenine glycosylase [Gorillibacterium sp. sgz500922]|uniref:DNA-3-methyladenine glycosylase n=1 Tax=Gorillibacterium sp. sgz500922 TaxID=3446694 RepID=UPI003F66A966